MTDMDKAAERDLITLLAGLRRDGRQRSGLDPRLVPPDEETAYRIAAQVAEELDWPVAGWKIAAFKPEMQRQLRATKPIYGRVFAPMVTPSPCRVAHATLCGPIPEVEFQVRLGSNLPPRAAPYTETEVRDAVASVHPGLELAECRFTHDGAFPPLPAILADGAGASRIIHGPPIENWWDHDIAGQVATLIRDGEVHRSGTAADAIDHPLVPVTWLANELSRTGIGLRAGQMISSGTLSGMLRPKAGETYVADFGALGSVSLTLD